MKYKVSIIIPLYNAEKSIDRCLKSIIDQSYTDLEIILVDNGCKDNTLNKVKAFRDRRIKILIERKKGASAARNKGLDWATGKYLLFVDSDDYIEHNMVEKLIGHSMGASMIFCNTAIHEKKGIYNTKVFNDVGIINKKEAMTKIVSGGAGLVCSKLISRHILEENNIRFNEELFWSEDQLFFLEIANKTDEIFYIEDVLYHYDKTNENSATNRYYYGLLDNFIKLQIKIEDIFQQSDIGTIEDKKVLNNKITRWFWDCIDNEVKVAKLTNIEERLKNICRIIESVGNIVKLELFDVNGITDRIFKNAIVRQSNISALNVMIISKLLMIKNG